MKKQMRSTLFKISLGLTMVTILIATLTIIAQTEKDQKIKKIDLSGNSTNNRMKKIISIRHVNILAEDLNSNGLTFEKKVPFIEIELFVGSRNYDTNLMHVVRIGETDFIVHSWTESGNAVLLIAPNDFNDLKDGASVSYRIGVAQDKEEIKNSIKNGESLQSSGASLGNLDKKMINEQPLIERKQNEKIQ